MAFIAISLDASDLKAKQAALANLFDKPGLAATLEAALEKAIQPVYQRLREVTPVGPTGNLRRAVAYKTVKYPKDGAAVGLVGYQQSTKEKGTATAGSVRLGEKRGFHQWWIEFGTKERQVEKLAIKPYMRKSHTRRMKSGKVAVVLAHEVKKGQGAVIASSLATRGQFSINPDGTKSQPYAFFMKGKKGQTALRIPAVPAGGTAGRPPVQTAFNSMRSRVAEYLNRELSISLQAAISKITTSSTGTITGVIGG
jgi:hypothetical protein